MKKILIILFLLVLVSLVFASGEIIIGFGEKNPDPFNWIETNHNTDNSETVVQ